MEWSKITDQIFIGTNMCCTMHFAKLMKLGVRVDIDLEKERVEKPDGLDAYLWLPVVDGTAPSQSQLRAGAAMLREVVNDGKKVYVHCKNGHGRGPTLVAAYLIWNNSFTPAEAVDFIKKHRPEIHPNDIQIAALEKFYSWVKKIINKIL